MANITIFPKSGEVRLQSNGAANAPSLSLVCTAENIVTVRGGGTGSGIAPTALFSIQHGDAENGVLIPAFSGAALGNPANRWKVVANTVRLTTLQIDPVSGVAPETAGSFFFSDDDDEIYFRKKSGELVALSGGGETPSSVTIGDAVSASLDYGVLYVAANNTLAQDDSFQYNPTTKSLQVGHNNVAAAHLDVRASAANKMATTFRGVLGQSVSISEWQAPLGGSVQTTLQVDQTGVLRLGSMGSTSERGLGSLWFDGSNLYFQNASGTTPFNLTQTPAAGISVNGIGSQTSLFFDTTNDFSTTDAAGTTNVVLRNVVTSGTATKVTYDAKGRVTSGTALSAGDLPAHSHSTADLTSGTLGVARGGTGTASFSTGLIKSPGGQGAFTSATAGTDYISPTLSSVQTIRNSSGAVLAVRGGSGATDRVLAVQSEDQSQVFAIQNDGNIVKLNSATTVFNITPSGGIHADYDGSAGGYSLSFDKSNGLQAVRASGNLTHRFIVQPGGDVLVSERLKIGTATGTDALTVNGAISASAYKVGTTAGADSSGTQGGLSFSKGLYTGGNLDNLSASAITSGILPINRGGTGATDGPTALTSLGAAPAARTLSAGAGLTGGGDLSANRSFALATVGTITPGPYTNADVTVDQYGRITSIANGSNAGVVSLNTLTGNLSITGGAGRLTVSPSGSAVALDMATIAGVQGSYTNANITVDQYGRITAVANGSGGATGAVIKAPTSAADNTIQATGDFAALTLRDVAGGAAPLFVALESNGTSRIMRLLSGGDMGLGPSDEISLNTGASSSSITFHGSAASITGESDGTLSLASSSASIAGASSTITLDDPNGIAAQAATTQFQGTSATNHVVVVTGTSGGQSTGDLLRVVNQPSGTALVRVTPEGALTLAGGTATRAPLVLGQASAQPSAAVGGALNYDGTYFYGTVSLSGTPTLSRLALITNVNVAAGDLLVGASGGQRFAPLAIGANGKVLTVVAGAVAWADPQASSSINGDFTVNNPNDSNTARVVLQSGSNTNRTPGVVVGKPSTSDALKPAAYHTTFLVNTNVTGAGGGAVLAKIGATSGAVEVYDTADSISYAVGFVTNTGETASGGSASVIGHLATEGRVLANCDTVAVAVGDYMVPSVQIPGCITSAGSTPPAGGWVARALESKSVGSVTARAVLIDLARGGGANGLPTGTSGYTLYYNGSTYQLTNALQNTNSLLTATVPFAFGNQELRSTNSRVFEPSDSQGASTFAALTLSPQAGNRAQVLRLAPNGTSTTSAVELYSNQNQLAANRGVIKVAGSAMQVGSDDGSSTVTSVQTIVQNIARFTVSSDGTVQPQVGYRSTDGTQGASATTGGVTFKDGLYVSGTISASGGSLTVNGTSDITDLTFSSPLTVSGSGSSRTIGVSNVLRTDLTTSQSLSGALTLVSGSSARPSLNIPDASADPSSLTDGDLWYNSSRLYFRQGTTSQDLLSTRVTANSTGTPIQNRTLNFIAGTNTTVTVTDDAVNNRTNVAINASSGGSGSKAKHIITLMSGFTPAATGADGNVRRIPPVEGGASGNWKVTGIFFRTENDSTGTSTVQVEYATGGTAFFGSSLGTALSITGASDYDASQTGDPIATLSTGTLLRANFTALDNSHGPFLVDVYLEEV